MINASPHPHTKMQYIKGKHQQGGDVRNVSCQVSLHFRLYILRSDTGIILFRWQSAMSSWKGATCGHMKSSVMAARTIHVSPWKGYTNSYKHTCFIIPVCFLKVLHTFKLSKPKFQIKLDAYQVTKSHDFIDMVNFLGCKTPLPEISDQTVPR